MTHETSGAGRSWRHKFADAFRGLQRGVRGQSSFFVHLFAAAAVVMAGWALRITAGEWCYLVLAIIGVLAAELFNTSLETLAAALHPEHHPEVGQSLDIASAAVLMASIGAVAVGLIIFLPRLWSLI
jgi:diacylglycerol kinase (ATP)